MSYWKGSGINLVEREETRECSSCESEVEVIVYYEEGDIDWTCPNCDASHSDYYDPADYYEDNYGEEDF